jgi:hypothetical protein
VKILKMSAILLLLLDEEEMEHLERRQELRQLRDHSDPSSLAQNIFMATVGNPNTRYRYR